MAIEGEDNAGWDEGDWDDDDDVAIPCPYCRRQIHEDAQRCPYCEQYLSDEDAPQRPQPLWIIAAAVVCLFLMLFLAFPSLFLRLLGI